MRSGVKQETGASIVNQHKKKAVRDFSRTAFLYQKNLAFGGSGLFLGQILASGLIDLLH